MRGRAAPPQPGIYRIPPGEEGGVSIVRKQTRAVSDPPKRKSKKGKIASS